MAAFRGRQRAGSCLSAATALVFVLVIQSVYSFEAVDYEDNLNVLIETGDLAIGESDKPFPDRKIDISKVKRKLDQYDRQILLFEHNVHRKTTRPLASNMVFMVWSLNLQKQAKKIVESCNETNELSEDGDGFLSQWFSTLGVNTWIESAMYKFVVGNAVHKWTEEKEFYTFDRNTCKLGKNCDEYIQVIWSTASHLGCELNFCDTINTASRLNLHNAYYIVCIYGEGKSRIDEDGKFISPFKNGTQCDDCPTGFSKCDGGLCQTDPPCETVVDCADVADTTYCLCDKATYDGGNRLTNSHWTWMVIWLGGIIVLSFFIVS